MVFWSWGNLKIQTCFFMQGRAVPNVSSLKHVRSINSLGVKDKLQAFFFSVKYVCQPKTVAEKYKDGNHQKGPGMQKSIWKRIIFFDKSTYVDALFPYKRRLGKALFYNSVILFQTAGYSRIFTEFSRSLCSDPSRLLFFFLVYNIFLISGKFRQVTSMRTQMCELDVSQSNHVFAYNI